METQEEELSDEELAQRLRFLARRAYGGERELLEQAERRILKKAESNEPDKDGNAGCGCLVWIIILAILLKIIGCV